MGASATVAKPLTLVSGYLGSGKTTLINHVLASGALGRAAVVVNDFGAVNIDAALIRSAGVDTIELTNGCICCQITDDVQRTMTALAARDDLDHVVCEVSGIGNPAQLGAWRTYPGFRPGGVVVCVDAAVTLKRLRDEFVADLVTAQIRAADLLVVTKADSVSDAQLARVREACVEIAGAGRGEAVAGGVGGGIAGAGGITGAGGAGGGITGAGGAGGITGAGGAGGIAAGVARGAPGGSLRDVPVEMVRDGDWTPVLRALDELALGRASGPLGGRTGTLSDVQAEGTASGHADSHASATVDLQEPVDVDRLVRVLKDHAENLMRAKGVVRTADGTRVVVQLAGGVVTSHPGPDVPERSVRPGGAGGATEPAGLAGAAGAAGTAGLAGAAELAGAAGTAGLARQEGAPGAEEPEDLEGTDATATRSALVLIAAGPHAQQLLRQAAEDVGPGVPDAG